MLLIVFCIDVKPLMAPDGHKGCFVAFIECCFFSKPRTKHVWFISKQSYTRLCLCACPAVEAGLVHMHII